MDLGILCGMAYYYDMDERDCTMNDAMIHDTQKVGPYTFSTDSILSLVIMAPFSVYLHCVWYL